jgi:hypothetical protein
MQQIVVEVLQNERRRFGRLFDHVNERTQRRRDGAEAA